MIKWYINVRIILRLILLIILYFKLYYFIYLNHLDINNLILNIQKIYFKII